MSIMACIVGAFVTWVTSGASHSGVVVSASSLANGALGEHHERIRIEIDALGC
jgi:hypothetical protein